LARKRPSSDAGAFLMPGVSALGHALRRLPVYGGRRGGAFGLAGANCRSVNPASSATSFDSAVADSTSQLEDTTMRTNTPARSTAPRRYITTAPLSALPFMHQPRRGRCAWRVPGTDDYASACQRGGEFAAHFAQYLRDNPGVAGSNVLGLIASGIDFADDSGAKGYWVGFFAYLERLIHGQAQRMDVFADVAQINADAACVLALAAMETEQ